MPNDHDHAMPYPSRTYSYKIFPKNDESITTLFCKAYNSYSSIERNRKNKLSSCMTI